MPPQNAPPRKTTGLPDEVAALPTSELRAADVVATNLSPLADETATLAGANTEPMKIAKAEPSDADRRFERLERLVEGLSAGFGRRFDQLAHVVDRLATAPTPTDDDSDAPAKRVRSDEHLAEIGEGLTSEELLRMLELKGQDDEVAKLRVEGISPSTHYIATDCMVIAALTADGKVVGTKVMPGEPIPREKLAAETIDWALKYPEGARLARPGEYRAPKPTPAHTR